MPAPTTAMSKLLDCVERTDALAARVRARGANANAVALMPRIRNVRRFMNRPFVPRLSGAMSQTAPSSVVIALALP